MEFKIDNRTIIMGILHALVAFTSIAVVTVIEGMNLANAFLFAGVNTILFHLLTKNKLPVTLGVSGLYIGSILFVSQTYGLAFVYGGIIVAGLVYVLFGLFALKFQAQLLRVFPSWLLSTVVLLIGLSLLPIGTGLIQTNIAVGVTALLVTGLVDLLGGKRLGMFAMPLGVLAGTLVAILTGGLDFSVMANTQSFEFIRPEFALAPVLTIAMIPIAVIFEMMGDVKNTGDIIGKDVFKEVGLGRISIGNGISTIIGGAGSSNAYTTYSESTAFVMLSRYYNPTAQIFTGLIFIVIAFLTPVMNAVQLIPVEAFGGVVTYLFALIAINSIKQIAQSGVDLNKDRKTFAIMITMLAVSTLTFVIAGVSVSSVAIATLVGVVLNSLFNRKG